MIKLTFRHINTIPSFFLVALMYSNGYCCLGRGHVTCYSCSLVELFFVELIKLTFEILRFRFIAFGEFEESNLNNFVKNLLSSFVFSFVTYCLLALGTIVEGLLLRVRTIYLSRTLQLFFCSRPLWCFTAMSLFEVQRFGRHLGIKRLKFFPPLSPAFLTLVK